MTIDKHTLALISIVGSSLDVLGALYLAYDLLGGEHGPLRTLTRAVTYSLSGIGYAILLGPIFGLTAGIATGITLAWEFSRASRHQPRPGFWVDFAMGAIRGAGYGFGTAYLFGPAFGVTFGIFSTLAQAIAYHLGVRPDRNYQPAARPRITRFQLLTGLNRTVGYAIAGYLSSLVAHEPQHAISVGVRTGLAVGVVTTLLSTFNPCIEWIADRMPAKRMGVYGVGLILVGFALQSVQYWLTLLDVSVR